MAGTRFTVSSRIHSQSIFFAESRPDSRTGIFHDGENVTSRGRLESTDAFARAAADLRAQRPIRSQRLQKIVSALRDKDFAFAEQELTKYLAGRADDANALYLMAQAARGLDRHRKAATHLAAALEFAPDFAAARFEYAKLLFETNEFSAALDQAQLLLAGAAGNPLFRHLKATILQTVGEHRQALAIFEQLASENPARAQSWLGYGDSLRMAGFQEKSVAAYRRAIACRPSFGSAWWSLANMKTIGFGDEDIAAIQKQLMQTEISPDDRVLLQFALGKAYEDKGTYDRSWEHYAKANAAMRLRADYDPDTLSSGVAANKRVFTAEFLRSKSGMGCPATGPIFILGRPRSGSTLVEQILCSHTLVEGTAELPYIAALARQETAGNSATEMGYPERVEQLDPGALRALGEAYLDSARIHRKLGRPFFIDKNPANYFYIGLIHLMLPEAKIIDVRRNPAAASLSIFKQYYSRINLRLGELGRFYCDYVELMAHFDRVMPGTVHRVIYEEMVANPEAEVRRLLDYLGLPFEEGCLRFYETSRPILTPSSEQVRRPISSEAVDHWRNYEPWLAALIKSLGSVLTDYPAVPDGY